MSRILSLVSPVQQKACKPIKNWAKDPSRHFFREDPQEANGYVGKMPHVRRRQGNAGQHGGVLGSDPLEVLFSTRAGKAGEGKELRARLGGCEVVWCPTRGGEPGVLSAHSSPSLRTCDRARVCPADPTALLTPGVPRVWWPCQPPWLTATLSAGWRAR